MNSAELKTILDLHEKWIRKEPDGKRADLSWSDLRFANLSGVDLHGADLTGADLTGANLRFADLSEAYLRDAILSGANIYRASLIKANLVGANLSCADLSEACLYMANLIDAKYIDFPISCPEKGSFIGFKKANGLIVELEIPSDALRSSATTRKCRCSKAKVISITNLDGSSSDATSIASSWDSNFIYTIGDMVEVTDFDTNRWNECAPGIHFFITRQEAVNY